MEKKAYLFMLPILVMLSAIIIYPLIYSIYISFHVNFGRPTPPVFVGLTNYRSLFTSSSFWYCMKITGIFTVAVVSLQFSLGLCSALLLNAKDLRGKGIFLVMFLLPWTIPSVTVGLIWRWIFNTNYGIFNFLMAKLVGTTNFYFPWLEKPGTALLVVIIASIWKDTPFATVVFLAAFKTIPSDLYEAAMIDGANSLQRFVSITIPMMRTTIVVVLLLLTMWSIRAFDTIYVLTGGGPMNSTNVIAYHAYRTAFKYFNLGPGASISYVIALFTLIIAIMLIKYLYSEE